MDRKPEFSRNGTVVKRKPNCKCSVCEKEVYRRPIELRKFASVYCSPKCKGLGQQKNIFVCQYCGVDFHRPNKKKAEQPKYCGHSCSNKGRAGKYKYGSYENPRNKAHKNRALKLRLAKDRGSSCEHCKEDNFYVLEVHHIVEKSKGGTDDLSNLELLCGNCHNAHHRGWGDMDDYIAEYNLEKWCNANL